MTWNDHCSSLIAIGSYAPGQANHDRFADLPGRWIKGTIVAELVSPPDDVGPAEREPIEAWVIRFADCDAEMFTPEGRAQERMLKERWAELDRRMGERWGRETFRWWPEGVETTPGCPGMIVVNMYVPIEHFDYLAHRPEEPDPGLSVEEQWFQVKRGESQLDSAHFLGLLKDATIDAADELFGDLPGGPEFVAKWCRFVRDHAMFEGSLLRTSAEAMALYVQPLERNALPPEVLVALAEQDRDQRAELLQGAGELALAEVLAGVEVVWSDSEADPEADPEASSEHPATEALERVDDYLVELCPDDHWYFCLMEAAYGVAAEFPLRDWLMATWLDLPVDLEPAYQLWRAGGRVRLVEGRLRVTEARRRRYADGVIAEG